MSCDEDDYQEYYEDLLTRRGLPGIGCACGWTGTEDELEEDPFWDGECEIVIFRCLECGGEIDSVEN